MRKIFAILLLLAMLVPMTLSCATLDTTGLLEAAPALIERAAMLNEVFYGEGIPFDRSVTDYGSYYPAEREFLEENGFSTVAELRAVTAEVFSAEYAALIAATSLSGFTAEGTTDYIYARYASSQAENLRDERETILVYGNSPYLTHPIGRSTYDMSTLRIDYVGTDYAIVVLSVTTVTKDLPPEGTEPDPDATPTYTTKTADMEIKFVYENGWRIDSPTY